MNFLLTGGTGFVGTRLVRRLLSRRHSVSMLTRHVRERSDRNVGQFFWNYESPAPAEPFRDVDAVIHLAGEQIAQRWSDDAKRRIVESRISGTRNLVEGIAHLSRKPRVLISASAVGYYGNRGDELLKETSSPGSGFLPDTCMAWEGEADRAAEVGLRVVKIRTGMALGVEGGALKKMLLPFKLGVGGVVGSGRQWMSWIHVDDLAGLMVFAAEHELTGPINGVAPSPVTNAKFTHVLGKVLRRPTILPVPAFALKLVFGEMSEVVLDSQRAVPEVAKAAGFEWRYPSLDGALTSLLLKH